MSLDRNTIRTVVDQLAPSATEFLARLISFPSTSGNERELMCWAEEAFQRLDVQVNRVPLSDGRIETAGIDVMHFTFPFGFATEVPSICQVFDLQHLHFPEYFDRHTFRAREATYRGLCARARVVVVMSRWVKGDLVERYGLPSEKVHVVNWAPIVDTYPVPGPVDLAAARAKYGLPDAFAFYPAVTWRHKNHLRLLEALAVLRDRGLRVDLVCSGLKNDFFRAIDARVGNRGVVLAARLLDLEIGLREEQ